MGHIVALFLGFCHLYGALDEGVSVGVTRVWQQCHQGMLVYAQTIRVRLARSAAEQMIYKVDRAN